MNFLLRSPSSHHVAPPPAAEPVPVREPSPDRRPVPNSSPSLEGLISEDPFAQSPIPEDHDADSDEVRGENGSSAGPNPHVVDIHMEVAEEEGWITIPYRELPDDWNNAPDIHSLRSLDRSFVFPGEQVHILACLSASQQDIEIITPFKVAAVMSKNGMGHSPQKHNGNAKDEGNSAFDESEGSSDNQVTGQNGNAFPKQKKDVQNDISASESLLRMEEHKKKTEILLQRFKNSHFFVRIAESGEPLWSKGRLPDQASDTNGSNSTANKTARLNAFIDKGNIDANVSGGAARNSVKCYPLSNGDIVVLLQVNIGVNSLRDPMIEILQFEKYQERDLLPEKLDNLKSINYDPCGELLKWLLPLDNTLPPPTRSLSPPHLGSNLGVSGASQKSASSGSQLLSHFRSYSMSSLPQNTVPPASAPSKPPTSRSTLELEDFGQYSSQKLLKAQKTTVEGFHSFRGVSLERERFSVRCGLEGTYIPGRKWRRKLELVQPVEIHSFAADCNTDDLICVQIKNVSPAHIPDIVVYIDALSIIFDEASKGGEPSSIPIACIEVGNDDCLPNLALRRGEEHSFILKPVSSMWKNLKVHNQKISSLPSVSLAPINTEGKRNTSNSDQYAVMVSCRCNYTESRLFFKQPTSWRPRISRDLMISVASEISAQSSEPIGRVSKLPVQVLTLQATNLTSDDLTMTVLAPASFTSPPTMGSLSSPPVTPMSPFLKISEPTGRISEERVSTSLQRLSSAPTVSENSKGSADGGVRSVSFNEQSSPISDVIPSGGFSCTHLWLQSRVPLGCVPSQSTATIKLDLLPLTDGIVALDTLRIDVKEKGFAYIPEYSLKINATSSISTGMM